MKESEKIKAGFWIRFSAIVIDTIIIFLATNILVIISRSLNLYIPFELTFLILLLIYSIISLGVKNATLGKFFCGLEVLQKDGDPIGYLRSLAREFAGKMIVVLVLPCTLAVLLLKGNAENFGILLLSVFLIFILLIILFIQYLITKRPWYDYISNTFVYQKVQIKSRNKYIILISIAIVTILIGKGVFSLIDIYKIENGYSTYALSKPEINNSESNKRKEISSIDSSNATLYRDWINNNGMAPAEFILDKVSRHQVTIFGESHGISNYLIMLKDLLPALYYKAGVRCIAMEVCVHEDDDLLNKLVTSISFDNELALNIGRHQPWLSWGGKEYWDILKAVWKLNRNIKREQDKMKIIGLDNEWDGPSIALTRGTESGKSGPLYEKLRFLRALNSFPSFMYRDELMAYEIEKNIVDKNIRGIVWVGSAHTPHNYKQPYQNKGRMAYILYKKYGNIIYQIFLHDNSISPIISSFIEKTIVKSKFKQVGFDLYNSPFNCLRDSSSYYFKTEPDARLSDLILGYVYLAPSDSLKTVKFIRDFVTPEMFLKEKPYYELDAGMSFANSEEVNNYYIKRFEK